MSQMEENIVYMILYNYQDADYSVIKIMNTLNKAYRYILRQENNEHPDINYLTFIEINRSSDIANKCKEDSCNVCVFNDNNLYISLNVCDTEHISSYIIVKITVE